MNGPRQGLTEHRAQRGMRAQRAQPGATQDTGARAWAQAARGAECACATQGHGCVCGQEPELWARLGVTPVGRAKDWPSSERSEHSERSERSERSQAQPKTRARAPGPKRPGDLDGNPITDFVTSAVTRVHMCVAPRHRAAPPRRAAAPRRQCAARSAQDAGVRRARAQPRGTGACASRS